MTRVLFALVLAGVLGCSTEATRKSGENLNNMQAALAPYDMRVHARTVPALAAQSEAVYQRIIRGLPHDVADLRATSVLVEDVDGYPFFHLVFIHPAGFEDPWHLGSAIDFSEGDGWGGLSLWSTTAVGASTARSELYFNEVGVDFAGKLTQTREALGGPQRVKRLVALTPTNLYIEDVDGVYWSVETRQRANEAIFDFQANLYRERALAAMTCPPSLGHLLRES